MSSGTSWPAIPMPCPVRWKMCAPKPCFSMTPCAAASTSATALPATSFSIAAMLASVAASNALLGEACRALDGHALGDVQVELGDERPRTGQFHVAVLTPVGQSRAQTHDVEFLRILHLPHAYEKSRDIDDVDEAK